MLSIRTGKRKVGGDRAGSKKSLIRQLEEDNIREEEAIAYLKELQESNLELNDDLLEIELRQMEDDDQILSDFERRYGDLVNKFVESAQNEFFTKARELENNFYQNALRVSRMSCIALTDPGRWADDPRGAGAFCGRSTRRVDP
eukprot:759816-Hanusia_phi.AAC.4